MTLASPIWSAFIDSHSLARRLNVAVIVPLYNEAEVFEDFNSSLMRELNLAKNIEFCIFYVVDPSDDQTWTFVSAAVSKSNYVVGILLSRRFGHQAALIAGIDQALNYDAIIMMDGDLQHPPRLIHQLIQHYRDGCDIVTTVRLTNRDAATLRKILGWIYYTLLRLLSDEPLDKNSADFRLISSKVARIVSTSYRESHIVLRSIIGHLGFRRGIVSYEADSRGGGRTKYALLEALKLAFRGALTSTTRPLVWGLYCGVAALLVSLVMILWTVYESIDGQALPDGWATLVILIVTFAGMQLFITGVLGMYIAAILKEVRSRPRYIIQKLLRR